MEHVQIICGKFVYTNRSLRHAQIACFITTWLYRNIVKTSAQSDQKMGFRKITTFAGLQKHFLFISCFLIDTFLHFISAAVFCSIASREKIPFAMCVQQLQNQTAQLINLEFIFHFIHIHVFMRTRSLRWRYAG